MYHQLFGLLEKLLISRRVRPTLLDQIIKQFRQLLVKSRVGELIADNRLADVVDDALSDGVLR